METIIKRFNTYCCLTDGITIVKELKNTGNVYLSILICNYLLEMFKNNVDLLSELSIMYYYTNRQQESINTFQTILESRSLSENLSKQHIYNCNLCCNNSYIQNSYTFYNIDKVNSIKKSKKCFITFTITTCKRFDLFEKTINSFLNTCMDLHKIDRWFCVDDNSSEEDRMKMQIMYPFFDFYFKKHSEKGHPTSMNIIKNNVTSPYIFQMEDDWMFYIKKNYISECLEVLNESPSIGQCLINKNYAETPDDIRIYGGFYHTTMSSGFRYYIHEFCNTDELKRQFIERHGENRSNCNYWPHFSFRPSLLKKSVLDRIGNFDVNVYHFELDYANKYVNSYKSSFLEGIYCMHIGRLTKDRLDTSKLNAYNLNDEVQFGTKIVKRSPIPSMNITYKVVNLKSRPDRMLSFENNISSLELPYERFNAIDGTLLDKTSFQLQQLFEGNDFNMRVGLVGCAMSHIKLYIEFLQTNYDILCVFEDDITFVEDFNKKLLHIWHQLYDRQWDIVYLGHHIRDQYKTDRTYSNMFYPKITKYGRVKSLVESKGGTGGYLISRKGVENLLTFISSNKVTNGIDTIQQKSADVLDVYYCEPHLIYSDCVTYEKSVDSDIQYNYNSLAVSVEDKLSQDILFYEQMTSLNSIDEVLDIFKTSNLTEVYYYRSVTSDGSDIRFIIDNIITTSYLYYTFSNSIIVIVTEPTVKILENRFFINKESILKKNNIYDISNILLDTVYYQE